MFVAARPLRQHRSWRYRHCQQSSVQAHIIGAVVTIAACAFPMDHVDVCRFEIQCIGQRQLEQFHALAVGIHRQLALVELGKRSGTSSVEAMEQTFSAALSVLGRDSSQGPAHLILAGKGAGAAVAAKLAGGRLRLAGLFFLGFPLHPQDRKEEVRAESLFRITSPMLFIQGTRDRRCDVDTLRETIRGVGASTQLHVIEEADQNFKVTKRSLRTEQDVRDETFDVLNSWLGRVIGEV